MSQNEKKVVAILGATGAQGGGLLRAILGDPEARFVPRAITRDANSPAAKEMARGGAEVVEADVDDAESLERAFAGAHAAFCVTFFWAHMSPEKELQHAGNMARAAKAARVRHTIWSTLEDTRRWVPVDDDRMPTLMGRYKVPHFDAKGEANAIFAELNLPTTYLHTSFYWENFIFFGMGPRRGEDGVLRLALPLGEAPLPGIAAEDIGRSAYAILKQGDAAVGKSFGVAGDHRTGAQMADALGRAFGEAVHYEAMTPEAYRNLGFPGAEDLGNMFQFKRDFADAYCAARNLDAARALYPGLMTFDRWLAANAARIPRT